MCEGWKENVKGARDFGEGSGDLRGRKGTHGGEGVPSGHWNQGLGF